jgi:uncharacterized protein YcaQ
VPRALPTAARLRRAAVARAFARPAPLADALARLGFVQVDPIRAPARAQDLVLRHRVAGYRAGDLERAYPALDAEEDLLYAYGVAARATWRLLHPRAGAATHAASGLAAEVLAFVRGAGEAHPQTVAETFGATRERNAWGGQSRATTRALEQLHHAGLLRVARRANGVRVYAPARPTPETPMAADERARELALLIAALFAPVPERSLRALLAPVLRRAAGGGPGAAAAVAALARSGALASGEVDGVRYLWPDGDAANAAPETRADAGVPPGRVRLLAPFDPLVWDRRRFEHLWGWPYRFEAYTPAPRRQFGYYALPLLWGDRVVGWANLTWRGGHLAAHLGFAGARPVGRAFARALEAELDRVRRFLAPPGSASPDGAAPGART